MTPIIIRVSALNDYPPCNRRGIARLLPQEIEAAGYRLRRLPRTIQPAQGTATHHGIAVPLKEKAATGKLPPVSVALDAARDALAEQLGAGEVQFEGPRGTAHNRNDAMAQVTSMVRSYHVEVAPKIEPIIVEEQRQAEVEPGIILTGHADLVAREPNSIRDVKTGAKPPASFTAQLGGYSLLARSHGLEIDTAAIDFLQRVHPKKPQPPPVTKHAPIADAEMTAANIIHRIAADIKTFREGDPARHIMPGDRWAFLPNPSTFLCSEKYCPAFGTTFCPEGSANK